MKPQKNCTENGRQQGLRIDRHYWFHLRKERKKVSGGKSGKESNVFHNIEVRRINDDSWSHRRSMCVCVCAVELTRAAKSGGTLVWISSPHAQVSQTLTGVRLGQCSSRCSSLVHKPQPHQLFHASSNG